MTPPWNSSGVLGGPERRHLDRRGRERSGPNRRKQARRRRTRTVLLAAAMSSAPGLRPLTALFPVGAVVKPQVDVSTEFEVIPAEGSLRKHHSRSRTKPTTSTASLIRAVMQAESAFHPYVVSRAGAEGLMQLMPDLADEMGVSDSFDPRENIMGGARYLKRLLDYHNGNIDLDARQLQRRPRQRRALRRRAAVPRNAQLRQEDQADPQEAIATPIRHFLPGQRSLPGWHVPKSLPRGDSRFFIPIQAGAQILLRVARRFA